MIVTFRIRRDTAANWTSTNPVLGLGEPGLETDTRRVKYGDGTTTWTALGYSVSPAVWGQITGTLANQTDLAAALAGKEPTIAAGTTGQYWRGDKSFQTLNKAAVGLANVDNTADASKSVLSATKLTTARTINGVAFDGTAPITINAVDSTARVPATRSINTTAPLTGGGDLSADRTLAISPATTTAPGSLSASDKSKLDGIANGATANTGTVTSVSFVNANGITGTITNPTTTPAITLSIDSASVTNAKLANVATATFKGRTTAGTGSPEDLTATQATALLNPFTSALKGLVPASGGGTTTYLRADGTFAAPPGTGVTSVSGAAPIVSSGGATPAISITAATQAAAGSMSAGDKSKVDGVSPLTMAPGSGVMGNNAVAVFYIHFSGGNGRQWRFAALSDGRLQIGTDVNNNLVTIDPAGNVRAAGSITGNVTP